MRRIGLGVVLVVTAPWGVAGQTPDPKAIDAGRKIYAAEKCFTCHQIAGKGNKIFPLDGVGSRLTPPEIRRWFTHTIEMEDQLPKRPAIRMSSKKYKFSDAELDALVAYLRSLTTRSAPPPRRH